MSILFYMRIKVLVSTEVVSKMILLNPLKKCELFKITYIKKKLKKYFLFMKFIFLYF